MIHIVNKYKHEENINDIYIGRGSPLGNPFTSITNRRTKACFVCASREESIEKHKSYLNDAVYNSNRKICDELNRIFKMALEGDVYLVCFCKPKDCHGDYIKEIIDRKLQILKNNKHEHEPLENEPKANQ